MTPYVERYPTSERGRTYVVRVTPLGECIQCLRCGMASFHPGDVDNRYCASCKQWHDDSHYNQPSEGA